MLLGFTINGAKQLGIVDKKGSITAGKDADYLVFDKDLLTIICISSAVMFVLSEALAYPFSFLFLLS